MRSRSLNTVLHVLLVFSFLVSLFGVTPATPAHAAGLCYVNDDAGGSNNGTSWTNAYTSLQSAIADSCTEIWVAAGTYTPHASTRTVSFVLESGTAIYGGFAGTETLLSQRNYATNVTTLSGDIGTGGNSSDNSHHVVISTSVNNTAILDGFTITGGNANGSNPYDRGGGMFNDSSSPTLTNVTFSANSATAGGGMFNSTTSNPTLTNVTFSANSASTGGGMYNISSSSPTLTNVTFSGNSASGSGGGMYNISSSSPTLTNVTFSGNSSSTVGGGGGMSNTSSSSPTLKNVIIANSTNGDCVTSASLHVNSSNNMMESTGTDACSLTNGVNGNIIGSDPALGSLTGSPAYFPLQTGSLAIDAGTNTGCPATDQRGVNRPKGSTCDIGSYEYIDYTNLTLYAKPSATGEGTCLSWADACTLQTAISAASSGNEIWVMQGTYTPHASDRTVSFALESGVEIYGGFAGTETLLSQRDYVTNVTILSGDLNGNDSGFTNNGENSYHVVYASIGVDSTSILDGFRIESGNANGGFEDDNGGGMYNNAGSPSLSNLSFSGNSATLGGGGMFNNDGSSPSLINITFSNNTSFDFGGGMSNDFLSNPSLTNVTFSGNSASFNGGGMFNLNNSPTLTNVTFSANSATQGGGMFNSAYTSSNPIIINTTFSGNSAATGGGMVNENLSNPTLKNVIIANSPTGGDCVNTFGGSVNAASSHNLIESTGSNACGITTSSQGGSNVIGSDPNLGSLTGSPAYFPLQTGSLAINAGTNTGCPSTSQNGVARPAGGQCDIGSFEKGGELPTTPTFGDVPLSHPYFADIEILYANGLTAGCSTSAPLLFCPDVTMNRAQSAVFMVRGNFGTSYSPPAAPWTTFGDDFSPGTWAQPWAQGMFDAGLTAGCSNSPRLFCPWEEMPRFQAAVFGMRLKYGNSYPPPAGTGSVFADIDGSEWYAGWVEQAYLNGLLPACGSSSGTPLFCPNDLVPRGLAAYMIVRAKNLSMP